MSDLISREELNNHISYIDSTDLPENECLKVILVEDIPSIPSADIMECARAIKEYCEQFPECEGCRFYNGLPFRCTFGICPQEWNLPEGEKGGN